MRITLKTSAVIGLAINHYLNSYDSLSREHVESCINYEINSSGETSIIESEPRYCAGVIGALADMGEGDLLISAI